MWIGHNCWINVCHFFDIVNLVIFYPDYIDRGYRINVCHFFDIVNLVIFYPDYIDRGYLL